MAQEQRIQQGRRPFRVGDIVRSKITGHTGPVLRVEQYDDGTPRITAELTKRYDVGQPIYHFELVRSADDGRVHDPVEAERQAYAVEDDVDRVDPENPTSMVVPVPGDMVLMTDGSTARVAARREVDGGVILQVQRTGLDYAEWVGVEEISGIEDANMVVSVFLDRGLYDVHQIARVIHADDLAHGWAAVAWEDMDQDSRDWYESSARAVRAHLLGED